MNLFLLIVFGHWAEHIVQIIQIYVLELPRSEACGLLGVWFPHLTHQEWFHFSYALFMLVGLAALRNRFVFREQVTSFMSYGKNGYHGRIYWDIALSIMIWHFFEHMLLLIQAHEGIYLFAADRPMSILQSAFPAMRAELHFFYNAAVTIPMVAALLSTPHRKVYYYGNLG